MSRSLFTTGVLSVALLASALAGGKGSGRKCNPDAAVCPSCKDCTRCAACAKSGRSCSVMRDQSGAEQRERDAKRERLAGK